jgi:hypothetical protein
MSADIRQEGHEMLDQVSEQHLPTIVGWLKAMVEHKDDPDFEPKMSLYSETEEEWEERVLTKALGDALNSDGSIDYNKVDLVDVSLDELEADIDDE